MGDVDREITENRQRVIALEKCTDEVKMAINDLQKLISNHLLHMVSPSFLWLVGLMSGAIGVLATALFYALRTGGM